MPDVRIRYLAEDVDRHGNVRAYVRVPGRPKVRIREPIGSPAFWAAYHAAVRGEDPPGASPRPPARPPMQAGTLADLVRRYRAGTAWAALGRRTQYARGLILERIVERDGDKPAALMEARHVRARRDELAARGGDANGMLKALRALLAWAVDAGLIDRNPARDVPYLKGRPGGFHSWTEEEVAAYEAAHPIGTPARLALALLLFTGQRRSDVVALGPQHVRDGWITITQEKAKDRAPVTLSIPILPELARIIAATPTGHLAFLVTEFGRPFTANGFGNRFAKWCAAAGLPDHCSAHGLRKAAAARLAEAGCTDRQIMAITGHRTAKEVDRYTRAAQQKVLARQAMDRLERARARDRTVPPARPVATGGTKAADKPLRTKGAGGRMVPRGGA